jgi:tetratricopeptide (TPR) repeat protein
MVPTPPLSEFAEAIVDGRRVDWAQAEAAAITPRDRARIGALGMIARIAGVLDSGEPAGNAAPPLAPGTRWGPLAIVEMIGRGSFGEVYRAHDPGLDREVALKLLDPSAAAHESEVVAEGRLLARVAHPNVVHVYGADRHDGRSGVWMELIEGSTLEDEAAARDPYTPDEAIAVVAPLCRAVAAVHDAGVLHRDIKLQNIIRDRRDGRPVLTDFSAGRESAAGVPVETLPRTLAGSPLYLAPEVIAGQGASRASDVYSLGVVLFRLLTGRFPVEGGTLLEVASAHALGERLSAGAALPSMPNGLAAIIARALDADPSRRFASADTFAGALASWAGRDQRFGRWRLAATVAGLGVIAIVGLTWWWNPGATAALPFAARDWVIVGGFDNRSGDPRLDAVPERALMRELTASGFVNVVSRPRIEDTLALMRRAPDSVLDARLAREVALRDGGIKAVVTGRVERAGAAFVLTTEIVHPGDGAVAASVSDRMADVESLPAIVQQQALRVRSALGETLATLPPAQGGLARVTTPSFEALRLYSEAAERLQGDWWLVSHDERAVLPRSEELSRFAAAEGLLRRAVERDPQFASAWLLLAHTSRAQKRQVAETLDHATRALAASDRLEQVERWFVEGTVHRLRADAAPGRTDLLEAAVRAFEALRKVAPDHYWGLLELGDVYRRLQRHADAERLALHAATLRPHSIRFGIDAVRALVAARQTSAAATRATALLARVPADATEFEQTGHDVAWLRLWAVADAWLAGDPGRALDLLRQADRQYSADTSGRWFASVYHAYTGLGRFDEARQLARRRSPRQQRFYLPLVEARLEDRRAFDAVAGEPASFERRDELTFMLIWVNRLADAQRLASERRQRKPEPWPVSWTEFEGHLRHAQGRHADAVAILEPLARDAIWPRIRMNEVLAAARARAGDLAGALAALEFTERRAIAVIPHFSAYDWLRARALLAQLYRDAGTPAQAAPIEQEVTRYLAVAEANHPLVARIPRERP